MTSPRRTSRVLASAIAPSAALESFATLAAAAAATAVMGVLMDRPLVHLCQERSPRVTTSEEASMAGEGTQESKQPWWKGSLAIAWIGIAIPAATFVQGWWQK